MQTPSSPIHDQEHGGVSSLLTASPDEMADALLDDDERYASSEDSDFAPDTTAAAKDSDQSASEDEGDGEPTSKRRRTTGPGGKVADNGDDYDNSGDEAIIQKGKRKQQRRKDKNATVDVLDDEEGGEGGLIKTRRQRAAEKEERKYTASTGPVTVDVDALWEQMLAGKPRQPDDTPTTGTDANENAAKEKSTEADGDAQRANDDPSRMVRIKRTYNFAGRVHTEEKLVARDSAEAKLYFASQGRDPDAADDEQTAEGLPAKRTAKKAFRSAFEPLSDPLPQRADLNLGVAARMQAGQEAQAKKLNTVEKSRMDWAGFVDKEGIKDELELAGKSKDSYTAREDFLARSEARRDEDARNARIAGRAQL